MVEDNKVLVRRLWEEMNKHNLAACFAMLHPDCLYRSSATGELKREAFRSFVTTSLAAFPDAHWTIDDQIGEGDKVVTRWTLAATHQGSFLGVAPTGKKVSITGMTIDRIVNGMVVEEREEWDTLGMMRQLGVVPAKLEELVAA